METALQVFEYKGTQVRTVERDGEIWFVAKDVCDILELDNITEALRGLDEDELSSEILKSGGQGREMRIISEPGLYTLLFRSNKAEAKVFARWVRHDVLPQVIHTGRYSSKTSSDVITPNIMHSARALLEDAGITGNQATIAIDNLFYSYTGHSVLKESGIELPAPTKHQLLTPTEIGREFGLSARRVNEVLAGAGYQYKVGEKWEPLGLGKEYAVMLDVGKKHGCGVPVRQLKWVTKLLRKI